MVRGRLVALSEAHALTVPDFEAGVVRGAAATTLSGLLRVLLAPTLGDDQTRVALRGPDLALPPQVVTPVALVVNELVTNAAKYGALRDAFGHVVCECAEEGNRVVLRWSEYNPGTAIAAPDHEGFGTQLSRLTIERQLGGTIRRTWRGDGLSVELTIDRSRLVAGS